MWNLSWRSTAKKWGYIYRLQYNRVAVICLHFSPCPALHEQTICNILPVHDIFPSISWGLSRKFEVCIQNAVISMCSPLSSNTDFAHFIKWPALKIFSPWVKFLWEGFVPAQSHISLIFRDIFKEKTRHVKTLQIPVAGFQPPCWSRDS